MADQRRADDWPPATRTDARDCVVTAGMAMANHTPGSQGMTSARGQYVATWTYIDTFREQDLPGVVLKHRPTGDRVGWYRTTDPTAMDDVEGQADVDDVFHQPKMLPGTPATDDAGECATCDGDGVVTLYRAGDYDGYQDVACPDCADAGGGD